MAIGAINSNEELLKRIKKQGLKNVGQIELQQGQQNIGAAENSSFEAKYGTNNVFGVDAGKYAGMAANPTYQTMGAQAGSAVNPATDASNNGNQNYSLADAIQMNNLPTSPTVTSVQAPVVPSAITATGGNEATGGQKGATENNNKKGSSGYNASHEALLASLSWSGTETVNNSAAPAEPKPTGEATLTTTNPENKTGTTESATAEGTTSPNGNKENINPNDSANKTDNKGDNGAGKGGADGSGKTAEQLAQSEAEKQAQILLEKQQQKAIEEQAKNAA